MAAGLFGELASLGDYENGLLLITQAFEKFDTDGSGELNKKAFTGACKALKLKLGKARLSQSQDRPLYPTCAIPTGT